MCQRIVVGISWRDEVTFPITMIEVRLAQLLEERGRSYYWLSKQTGIDHTVIGRLLRGETGSIMLRTIAGIYTALDCTPNDLFVVKSEPSRNRRRRAL